MNVQTQPEQIYISQAKLQEVVLSLRKKATSIMEDICMVVAGSLAIVMVYSCIA